LKNHNVEKIVQGWESHLVSFSSYKESFCVSFTKPSNPTVGLLANPSQIFPVYFIHLKSNYLTAITFEQCAFMILEK
jgi:hypothetical protein